MKAKEIAKWYNEEFEKCRTERDLHKLMSNIAQDFLNEGSKIVKQRNINIEKNPSAYFKIFKELNSKWNAFARRVDGVKKDGFKDFLCNSEHFKELNFRLYWDMFK